MWAESADDIESAFAAGKVASLVGVESGYAISSNMAVLRTLYAMGARSGACPWNQGFVTCYEN